jgi:hypothetical protein
MKPVPRRLPSVLLLNALLVATFSQAATAAEIALGDQSLRSSDRSGVRGNDRGCGERRERQQCSRWPHVHKNILESAKYPTITFKPDRIEGAVNLEGIEVQASSSQIRQ